MLYLSAGLRCSWDCKQCVCALSEVCATFCQRQEGTLALSSSPERLVEEDSSSKISPAFRPGAGSALQPAAPPSQPPSSPAPSPLRRAPRSLVIPDALFSLSPFSLAVGEETAREMREGLVCVSASAVMES